MSLADQIAEQHAQLASIKASEVDLTDGPEAALRVLGPPTDAIRFRAALAILARSERFPEAADLIRARLPHEKWIDLGAVVFAYVGEIEQASSLVDRADEYADRTIRLRTRLGFAEGILARWQKHFTNESILAPRKWADSDLELARKAIDVLDPMLSLVRANLLIESGLELNAVTYAIQFAQVMRDQPLIAKCASWLKKHVPVPLIVAELCLRRLTECPTDLPNRLRREHPGEFQPTLLGAIVDRDLLHHAENAFDVFVQLASEARNDDEREWVSVALFETCGICAPNRIDEAIKVVASLQPNNLRRIALLQIFKKMVANDLDGARSQLDIIRDVRDGVWWQAHAQVCEMAGDEAGAQVAWEEASKLLPHPRVLRCSVQASLDQRRFESAVRDLKKLLVEEPDNERYLWAVASALVQMGDYRQATEYLEQLVLVEPSDAHYRISLAQCLAHTGQTKKAVLALEPLCLTVDAPIVAILIQSELLKADGRPKNAFELLRVIAAEHWDEPEFLLRYINCAHAAEEDEMAHEAFVRLLELRHAGKVPAELLQEKTLDDLINYGKEYQRIRENLQEAVVAGRMPWLWAEDQLRNPPTWAWALHTQDLKWNSEESLSRAAFSIYATNGFTVCVTNEGTRLEPIRAIGQGSEVVVDLSALLTLNALQRLERVAEFFGVLILPGSYGDLRNRYGDRFGEHQPSRETELLRIRAAVEDKRIRVVGDDVSAFLTVNEYSDAAAPGVYRLKDLLRALQKAQKATSEMVNKLLLVAHKAGSNDDDHPPLDIGSRLLLDLTTLRTLASQPIYEVLLDNFAVNLTESQSDEVIAELRAYERARAAKMSHFALWDLVLRLLDSGRIRFEPVPLKASTELETDDGMGLMHLDAALLARSLGKSLLADDRVLQVLMYQEDAGSVTSAFDTGNVLLAMLDGGISAARDTANDFRRLVNWRYRFLVPSDRILFEWALGAGDNPPGDALLEVAAYLHDCLRDPGLPCRLEPANPPLPMAAKLVTSWSDRIARFVAMIWTDDRFSDDTASKLTEWVGAELIPSCPRGLFFNPMGHNLVQAEQGPMMGMFMLQFASVPDRRRANLGLRILAESLGVDEDAFLTATAEVIHAIETA